MDMPEDAMLTEEQVTGIVRNTQKSRIEVAAMYAWHCRDTEVAALFDDAERWEDYAAKMIIERDAALEQVKTLVTAGGALRNWAEFTHKPNETLHLHCSMCDWDAIAKTQGGL